MYYDFTTTLLLVLVLRIVKVVDVIDDQSAFLMTLHRTTAVTVTVTWHSLASTTMAPASTSFPRDIDETKGRATNRQCQ
jgi:hypothetical protein